MDRLKYSDCMLSVYGKEQCEHFWKPSVFPRRKSFRFGAAWGWVDGYFLFLSLLPSKCQCLLLVVKVKLCLGQISLNLKPFESFKLGRWTESRDVSQWLCKDLQLKCIIILKQHPAVLWTCASGSLWFFWSSERKGAGQPHVLNITVHFSS